MREQMRAQKKSFFEKSQKPTSERLPQKLLLGSTSAVLSILCLMLWGCDYARMKEQESVRTYESRLPDMPSGTVPVEGGLEGLRVLELTKLKNPLGEEPRWIEQGREAYGFYCSMCHGPKADGRGTVGQSFHPLPSDLGSRQIQELSDGEIFGVITLGSKRSPPLGYTIKEEDRWAIVRFLRSLPGRGVQGE